MADRGPLYDLIYARLKGHPHQDDIADFVHGLPEAKEMFRVVTRDASLTETTAYDRRATRDDVPSHKMSVDGKRTVAFALFRPPEDELIVMLAVYEGLTVTTMILETV